MALEFILTKLAEIELNEIKTNILDPLPEDINYMIYKTFFTNSVLPELMEKTKFVNYSKCSTQKQNILSERGAYTKLGMGCPNCKSYGFPCMNCWCFEPHGGRHTLKPHMFVCMEKPSDDVKEQEETIHQLIYNDDIMLLLQLQITEH
jgi:hypothetical protein